MRLDQTRIAIRERTFAELLDLALRVVRAHGAGALVALAAGAIPTAILIGWLLRDSSFEIELGQPDAEWGYVFSYIMLMLWLLPLATAPLTLFLGQLLFADRPSAGEIARQFFASLPQLIVYQLVLRGIMLIMFITWIVLFASWPYLNEVILLERNPWRTKKDRRGTLARTSMLHARRFGDLLMRAIFAGLVASLLLFVVWQAFTTLRSIMFTAAVSQLDSYTIYFPLSVWLVAGFMTIVRFLSYLDLRIRTEGWEVELRVRSEAARLEGRIA